MKTTFEGYEVNLGEASAFIKVSGILEGKDKEEALESVKSFAKSILARNPEKLKWVIEKNKKEN